MKLILKFNAFLILSLCLFIPTLNATTDLPLNERNIMISMDFQNASLKDIIKVLSIQSGLNFIASEAVQDRMITLYLEKVPLDKAMDKLFKANNLSYELDKDSKIFVVKDWGKLQVETITKIFYLKHASVSSSSLKSEVSSELGGSSSSSTGGSTGSSGGGITDVIKGLLSGSGSLVEDPRTNSFIVTDTPNRLAVISQIITSLDVPIPQVLLEVELLDVSKNAVDTIGIKYGQTPLTVTVTGSSATIGFPFENWSKIFLAEPSNRGTLAIASGYQVQLDYLRTLSDTRSLARPKLLTLNNQTAEIKIATQESVGLTTSTSSVEGTGTTTQEPERSETGIILRVTPQVNVELGEITMFVYPKVAESVGGNTITSGSQTYTFRDPEERSTKTMIKVKDGETVVIGGLIRNDKTEVITKLPILGDIPLIGAIFRHKNKSKDRQRELLIFITPHIIKDSNVELAQIKKPALPEREQDTVSMINRELAISTSLNSFEKKKR